MVKEIMHDQKYIMTLTGTISKQFKSRIYKIFSVFIQSYYHIFMVALLINAITKWHCKELFMEMICYYTVHINAAIMNLFAKRNNMKKVLSSISHYERISYTKEDKASRHIYSYYSKLNCQITRFTLIGTTTVGCISWYLITIIYIRMIEGTEECPIRKGQLYQISYPFNTKYNYWLSIVFDLTMCYIGVLMHIQSRIYAMTLVNFQLAQIKILANMLRNVDKNAKRLRQVSNISMEKSIEITINQCIKRHQEVISLMSHLQIATKEMMLFGFFSNTVELSGFTIHLLTATTNIHLIRGTTIFSADIIQNLVFFWLANEVYVQSMELSYIIYHELNWLSYNKETQKKLIMMMLRSQKALQFRASGIGEMTLVQYIKILKSCYSMATFFKTVYDV